ncbi:MAG: hypothetical protein AAB217_07525, partial [Chloroflexota bacterium]
MFKFNRPNHLVSIVVVLVGLALTPIAAIFAAPVYFSIGSGLNDVIPHQLVRANNDRLYIFAPRAQYSSEIRGYYTTSAGLPNNSAAFTSITPFSDTSNIFTLDTAYDGANIIHVLWRTRSGELRDRPFDITTNTYKATITLATGLPTISGDYIGSSGLSGMFDAAGKLHVAYWSAANHITHRAYTYNATTDTLTLVEGPTQVDTTGSANHPIVAVSPSDNSLTVAWVSEAANPKKILARTRSSAGSWGNVENASTSPVWTSANAGINIDQGPSLVIDSAGVKHLAYMENWDNTNNYGRIHYVRDGGSGWTDQMLTYYTHGPAVALNGAGEVYILGHGYSLNPSCTSITNICTIKRNGDGTWGAPQLFANVPSSDASISIKWSAIGFNRPETIEFLFFSGAYTSPTLYYARLDSNGPTPTPTTTWTPSNTPTNTATHTATFTATDTLTPTNTPTSFGTPTDTPTATLTFTHTSTNTPTATFTPTQTFTPSNTPTSTSTATATTAGGTRL